MKLGYMGIDQYGEKYIIKKHPRKELMDALYATGAQKMYVDITDGKAKHIGYIVARRWIRVYAVNEWKAAQ